jgi:hypothetical protein
MFTKFADKFKTYYDLHNMEEERTKILRLKHIRTEDITDSDIKEIISFANRHKLCLELLPNILTIMSNICMTEINVARFEYDDGIKIVIEILKLYENNSKIQWLVCSCIWNICRVPNTRSKVSSCFKHLLQNLHKYSKDFRVLNTTLGALSNISLLDCNRNKFLRLGICNSIKHFLMRVALKNVKTSVKEKNSLTSCFGLIANLAISNSDKFVKEDIIYWMMKAMKNTNIQDLLNPENDDTTYTTLRNFLAGLNNLADRDVNYKKQITKARGYEFLHELYLGYITNPDIDESNNQNFTFLETILQGYVPEDYLKNTDLKDFKTSSLHICAFYNYIDIFVSLLKDDERMNIVDYNKNTILHVAVNGKSLDVIKYICSLNILRDEINNDNLTMYDLIKQHTNEEQENICQYIQRGYILHDKYKKKYNSIFLNLRPEIPIDLINIFLSYSDRNIYQFKQAERDTKKFKKCSIIC